MRPPKTNGPKKEAGYSSVAKLAASIPAPLNTVKRVLDAPDGPKKRGGLWYRSEVVAYMAANPPSEKTAAKVSGSMGSLKEQEVALRIKRMALDYEQQQGKLVNVAEMAVEVRISIEQCKQKLLTLPGALALRFPSISGELEQAARDHLNAALRECSDLFKE